MLKQGNHNVIGLFSKLLELEKSTLHLVDSVVFDGKQIHISVFDKYTFLFEKIAVYGLENDLIVFDYSGASPELKESCLRMNKKYSGKKIETFLGFLLKNTSNNIVKFNYPSLLLMGRDIYPEMSFLLGNVHNGISNETYKKISHFNFLEDYLSRRNERDSIEIKASYCNIEHAEGECTYCNPQGLLRGHINYFYNLGNNFSIDYSYYIPKKEYNEVGYATFIDQNETIVGGSVDKIEEILSKIDYSKFDYIHVNMCCLPTIIGDDVKSITKRYSEENNTPIINTDQNGIRPYKILKELLENVDFSSGKVEKNTCVFVGFPHQKGLFELKEILSKYGVDVKDVLLPIIEAETLNNLKNIQKLALIDTGRSPEAIEVFENIEKDTFRVCSPYGFESSINFINSILKEFGIDSNSIDIVSSKTHEFNELKKSNNYGVGFMLLPGNLNKFLGNFRGLNILKILSEMGFKINIFYYIDKNSEYKDKIKSIFEKRIDENSLGKIVLSNDLEDLDNFLNDDEIDLYYSEVLNDSRIIKANKQMFSTAIFEVGIDGIIRSFKKLLRLSKNSKSIREVLN